VYNPPTQGFPFLAVILAADGTVTARAFDTTAAFNRQMARSQFQESGHTNHRWTTEIAPPFLENNVARSQYGSTTPCNARSRPFINVSELPDPGLSALWLQQIHHQHQQRGLWFDRPWP